MKDGYNRNNVRASPPAGAQITNLVARCAQILHAAWITRMRRVDPGARLSGGAGFGGVALLRRFRQHCDTPVVFLSPQAEEIARELAGTALEAHDYIA
jgi:hypothetical protein